MVAAVFASVLIGPAAAQQEERTLGEERLLPGDGRPVRLARATWDTGWFQAAILAELLTELGYDVEGPDTYTNADFYAAVTSGTVDLWANGWFPLHQSFLTTEDSARPIGTQVRGGALQGYLVDRATAERFGIGSLSDLADPEIAAVFDRDGDGRADLIGCERTWSCAPVVDHHLAELGLETTVDHVQGAYTPNMLDLVQRFDNGDSVLFYTFTPNWTLGTLELGEEVVWLDASDVTDPTTGLPATTIDGLIGCTVDPCSLGFEPNDIRFVASTELLSAEPAIAALLERIEIALTDIDKQNAVLIRGRDSEPEINEQAGTWIDANGDLVDGWIADAIEAHVVTGGALRPRPDLTEESSRIGRTLSAVARVEAPYVQYGEAGYSGFSVELIELIATDLGTDVEIYAVNSSAKLVDDVVRGATDIGIGALPMTAEREARVDFSQPYIDFELAIATESRNTGLFGGRLSTIVSSLFSFDLLVLIGLLAFLLVVAAHVIWWTERGDDSDFAASYREGIWEGFWWAAVTATTVGYGDKTPRGHGGRIFGLVWMFIGLFLLAYLTGGVAAAFAVDEISAEITRVSDLRGRTVGVTADSLANDYLEQQGIPPTVFSTVEEAYVGLERGELDAVVHDAVTLKHLIVNDPDGGVELTGSISQDLRIGFAIAADEPLLEAVNRSLLELIESGRYAELHSRWLGSDVGDG